MTTYIPHVTLHPEALPFVYEGLLRRGAWRDARSLWSVWRARTPVPFEISCIGWKTPYTITLKTIQIPDVGVRVDHIRGKGIATQAIPFEKVVTKSTTSTSIFYKATLPLASLGDGICRCYLEPLEQRVDDRPVQLALQSIVGSDALGREGRNGVSTEMTIVNGAKIPKESLHMVSHICLRSFGFMGAETMAGLFACLSMDSPNGMGVPMVFPKNVYDLSHMFYHQLPRFNQPAWTWTLAIDDAMKEVKFSKWQEPLLPVLFNSKGKFLSPAEARALSGKESTEDIPKGRYHILTPAFTFDDPYVWTVILHHAIRMSEIDLLQALLTPPLIRPLGMNRNALQWLKVNEAKLKDVVAALSKLPPVFTYSEEISEFLRAREFHRQQEKAEKEKQPGQKKGKEAKKTGKRALEEGESSPAKRAKTGK